MVGKWWCKTGSGERAYCMFCFSNYSDWFTEKLKIMCLVNLSFHIGYHENDWFLRCSFMDRAGNDKYSLPLGSSSKSSNTFFPLSSVHRCCNNKLPTSTTLFHIMCMSNKHTAFKHRGYSSKMILLLYIFNQKSLETHIKSKQDKKYYYKYNKNSHMSC